MPTDINKKDILIMKLVHYFVTVEDYNPIILHGIKDEIWLENLNSPYKVIRIINHYIHNNEQLSFDKFKLKQITTKLKRKTLTTKMNVLNIYTDLGDNVQLQEISDNEDIFISKISDLKKTNVIEMFPNILDKTNYKEKGMDLFVKITDDINKNNEIKNKQMEKIFSKKNPIITYIIIAICVILFGLMYIIGNGSTNTLTLLKFGANLDVLTKGGEYYRLLTCAFLHIGFFHLLFNMYALYIIGSQIENYYGKIKYLIIYIVSAVSASILSLAFSSNVVSAGASGAIFGLLGAMLYFGYNYRVFLGNVIKSQIIPIILINLVIGFYSPGIDNAAHIGGLIAGVITSMALGINDKNEKKDRINGIILLLVYICFIVYLAFFR